jgi:ribosome-binding factor A
MGNSMSQPSQRQLRVGEQIKHVIAEMLARGEFQDAGLIEHSASITVTEVRVTPDLKMANAYIVGQDAATFLPALNAIAHVFQKEINKQTQLKFTPKVSFRVDETFDKALRLDSIISNLKYSDQD